MPKMQKRIAGRLCFLLLLRHEADPTIQSRTTGQRARDCRQAGEHLDGHLDTGLCCPGREAEAETKEEAKEESNAE